MYAKQAPTNAYYRSMRGSLFGYTPYLFLLKTSTFCVFCSIGTAFTFSYLDLLQGAVLIVMAMMFTFGNGAADGTIAGIIVEHGYNLLCSKKFSLK